ncbi:hypothetical protein [uncultured Campylobacter sp.]|uniref:hypothetical protein n=1 Tax=uncultured Campylobacter sp. TaxID=218934 RepID=UPI00260CD7D4|nr:hypothetical protein [uncultured Campylobacter sp.]
MVVNIAVHCITLPLLGLTPPLFQLPWYEFVSGFFWARGLVLGDRSISSRSTKPLNRRARFCGSPKYFVLLIKI